jgi:hypothetical protein
MRLTVEKEKSGDPESRISAQRYLEVYKTALARGEKGALTGKDLRLINLENEVRLSDPAKADKVKEYRRAEKAKDEKELSAYFENLRAKIGKK